jgi:hypothetical protein
MWLKLRSLPLGFRSEDGETRRERGDSRPPLTPRAGPVNAQTSWFGKGLSLLYSLLIVFTYIPELGFERHVDAGA